MLFIYRLSIRLGGYILINIIKYFQAHQILRWHTHNAKMV